MIAVVFDFISLPGELQASRGDAFCEKSPQNRHKAKVLLFAVQLQFYPPRGLTLENIVCYSLSNQIIWDCNPSFFVSPNKSGNPRSIVASWRGEPGGHNGFSNTAHISVLKSVLDSYTVL